MLSDGDVELGEVKTHAASAVKPSASASSACKTHVLEFRDITFSVTNSWIKSKIYGVKRGNVDILHGISGTVSSRASMRNHRTIWSRQNNPS